MTLALILGALEVAGSTIMRSGIRWLVNDGQHCAANEIIGYCNIVPRLTGARDVRSAEFSDEHQLQVAFATPVAGRIRIGEDASPGGYRNIVEAEAWDSTFTIAHLEPEDASASSTTHVVALRQMVLAGRRMTQLADVHSGLLAGWLGRSRGWWSEGGEEPLTLLSLGICDATSVVLGEETAFHGLFAEIPRATHIVFYPDHPVTPAVPVLLDQLKRTPSDLRAISANVRKFMSTSAVAPTAADWMFVGTLLLAMSNTPITDYYKVFTGDGAKRLGPAQTIILSLAAEPLGILRHRNLGYHLYIMPHHLAAAGPATRAWLASEFVEVKRSVSDIRRDYETLIDQVAAKTGAKLIVVNRMSTSGREDVSNYSYFETPLSDVLASVAAKELNLMLHDIAEQRELYILDVDAIAAELGGAQHITDGVHYSRAVQSRLQAELAAILESNRSSPGAGRLGTLRLRRTPR
jgi:hypothetical protein